MPVIQDPSQLPGRETSIYPEPFADACNGRFKRALTTALGLTQFGINMTTLKPGAKSSLRHWHVHEDEAVYILDGKLTLVDDNGRHELGAGMWAGFPAGVENAHHLINTSNAPATYLEIGTRSPNEDATYPDVDLVAKKRDGEFAFCHKDGTSY